MPIAKYFAPLAAGIFQATDGAPTTHPPCDQYVPPGFEVPFQLPQFILSAPPVIQEAGEGGGVTNETCSLPWSWSQNSTSKLAADDVHLTSVSAFVSPRELLAPSTILATCLQPELYRLSQLSTAPNVPSLTISDKCSQAPSMAHRPLSSFTSPKFPVYSSTGFDILNILSRVATRRSPKITLGPVDLTCSFVVVDARGFDNPIIYCSETFCKLTGYEEREVLGRNCRFLQSPHGSVQRGERRQYTSPEAVMHLKRSLSADKECQTSLINFRKGGQAFMNLVTVIPIEGGLTGSEEEKDRVAFHVGFQIDLTDQPNRILEKLREGTYISDFHSPCEVGGPYLVGPPKDRKDCLRRLPGTISKDLSALLIEPSFIKSIPLSSSTIVTPGEKDVQENRDGHHVLNLILLESSPDFIHVLSLKGNFLYVAPSVRIVLGYQPHELVGKSVADFCHPADVIPVMRELKDSSTVPSSVHDATTAMRPAKSVDLLYRARDKSGGFIWVEARGRLFIEPGKGRKAIILSGRTRRMQSLDWGAVAKGGGFEASKEFWGSVCAEGTFLIVGSAVREVLGWGVTEVMGRMLANFVVPDGTTSLSLPDEVRRMAYDISITEPKKFWVNMVRKDGGHVGVIIVLYRPTDCSSGPSSLICQIKVAHPSAMYEAFGKRLVLPFSSNIFEELETSRGSSWQYELQQLKYSNQHLLEEIALLESQTALPSSAPPPSTCHLASLSPSHREWPPILTHADLASY